MATKYRITAKADGTYGVSFREWCFGIPYWRDTPVLFQTYEATMAFARPRIESVIEEGYADQEW